MNKIKEKRFFKQMSQAELASMLGVKQAAVSAWETGMNRIPLPKLIQMAEIFGCTLDDLIDKEIKST